MSPFPANITSLAPNEIFVFGSNRAGRHGRGAAKTAMKWGAKYGVGEGLSGRTYGISTKDANLRVLPLLSIRINVERFFRQATNNSHLTFLVTEIGCGLAGYKPAQIAPMFRGAPENVRLPESFIRILTQTQSPTDTDPATAGQPPSTKTEGM